MPTGTRDWKTGVPEVRSKISSVPLGVFSAKRVIPSGEVAKGRTGPDSKATKAGPVEEAETFRGHDSNPAHVSRARATKAAKMFLGVVISPRLFYANLELRK